MEPHEAFILRHPPAEEMDALVAGECADPHAILGAHPLNKPGPEAAVIRVFHPEAVKAEICLDDAVIAMESINPGGIYACYLEGKSWPFLYKVRFTFRDGSALETIDPYRFLPTLGDLDTYLIGEGKHYELYERMGAHLRTIEGVDGVSFAVWAPNAKRVSIIGDFNGWDGRLHPMRTMGACGVWEIFMPGLTEGAIYKYELKTQQNDLRIKTDPYAFFMEVRPKSASIVWEVGKYEWKDGKWMNERPSYNLREKPVAIYEVHLGSWMRVPEEENRWLTYRELAPKLVEHVKRFGFTHLELMPIAEHPFDASWGYQVTGYFAPTSRFGNPDDFMFFVDTCHQNGIGVIVDWVPAHFPKDDFSLRWFDGTALYEHADPRMGEHRDWGTLIFNYGRKEVANFLLSNALFWLDKYHIDGLRVDAVASMLYLDYSKQDSEWLPNKYGGRENLEAIDFVRHLNETVYGLYPGCFTIAEESTDWGGVSSPTYLGGLGFGFKWDMGWMHDTLTYFSKDPIHRRYHHNDLTFSMLYFYSENFILPLSHDEVVYGKGSLLNKMPGDEWQKFANLRTLMAYMYCHTGKKILFMGSELAPYNEWCHDTSLEWHLEADPMRQKFQLFLKDLGQLYLQNPALWEQDHLPKGFSWIDCNDSENSVISFARHGRQNHLICVYNLTPVTRYNYYVGVPGTNGYRERLNTDSSFYGGSNVGNGGYIQVLPVPYHGHRQSVCLKLPPLGCLILEPAE